MKAAWCGVGLSCGLVMVMTGCGGGAALGLLQGLLFAGLLLGAWGCASSRQPGGDDPQRAGGEPQAGSEANSGGEPRAVPARSPQVMPTPVITPGVPSGCGPDDDCAEDWDGDGYNSDQDCDDSDSAVNPGMMEIENNGIDDDCDGLALEVSVDPIPDDIDGDGWLVSDDCDDQNADVSPDADEQCCDLVDNDCNPMTTDDLGFCNCIYDADADGFTLDVDCDDSDPAINPASLEDCGNGLDDDCDGLVDFNDGDCVIGNG